MKGRIGKYKDKIVVWGDPNLTAKNEINIDSLGEGRQADIPIEYYKVVAPEGENLDDVRRDVVDTFTYLTNVFSCFHILVKGTSLNGRYRLFAGATLIHIGAREDVSVHAYAIRSFKVIFKTVDAEGTLREVPSFNNIFDAIEVLGSGASLQLKQYLVPITAEEFYNLDDLK